MKNYIKTIFFVLLIQSCSKDALDLVPQNQVLTETFWKTESDASMALTACYDALTGRLPVQIDGLSDDAYANTVHLRGYQELTLPGPLPTSTWLVPTIYTTDYQGIARINYFLANIGQVEMNEETRKKYKAEALFLRAYLYFELAHLYGDVIIVKEPVSFEESKLPKAKSNREEVIALVHEDLDQAIEGLPDQSYTDGHAVKGAAQALKARVLLYEKRYTEAALLAKTIIDNGKFNLYHDYVTLFYKAGQSNNPEIMFSIRSLAPNKVPGTFASFDVAQGWLEEYQPTQSLVNEYECVDGLSISSSPLYNPDQPYENRDPRLGQTIFVPGSGKAQGWNSGYARGAVGTDVTFRGKGGPNANVTGFAGRKMLDPKHENPVPGTISDQDYILIRYAEVLLIYAEAINESSTSLAYDAINEVRTRPGTNMPPLPAGLSQDNMRQRIRHEYRIEFALEGLRYYNLRRWGIAQSTLNNFYPVPDNFTLKPYVYEARFAKWPLPQTEIDRTLGLVQNENY